MAGMQAGPSSAGTSAVDILIIPASEETTIARHCAARLSG
jgi:hypothetical protein